MLNMALISNNDSNLYSIIENSGHAQFISNSLGGMSNAEILDIVGEEIIANYRKDQELKTGVSYRQDAHKILARVQRVYSLLNSIDQDVSNLVSDNNISKDFKELLRRKVSTKTFRSSLSDIGIEKILLDVYGDCSNQIRIQRKAGNNIAEKLLRSTKSHALELSYHAHYFAKNKWDPALSTLLDVAMQKTSACSPIGSQQYLSYVKGLAETGLFGLDDIAREAIGGATFIKGIKNHFYEL